MSFPQEYYLIMADIARRFNDNLLLLIKLAQERSPQNTDIIRARRVFNIAKQTDESLIIRECADNFWKYRNKIQKNSFDFMENPETIEYTQKTDFYLKQYSTMIKNLTDFLNAEKHLLSEKELNYIYNKLNSNLNIVAEYRALTLHGLDFYKKFIAKMN